MAHDMDEWPLAVCPIFSKWAGSITSYAPHDKRRTVLQQVTYSDVDTRIDMVFINEDSLHDVLDDVFGDTRRRWATQPLEREIPRQLPTSLFLGSKIISSSVLATIDAKSSRLMILSLSNYNSLARYTQNREVILLAFNHIVAAL
jgi:hypothetical protein